MDARVIYLPGNPYSERVAKRCIQSANIRVEPWPGFRPEDADTFLEACNLRWTWGEGYGLMKHHDYGGNTDARVACFLAHYSLWRECVRRDAPMLVLEHDAVFVRPFEPFEFENICMINDPLGATPRGEYWSEQMQKRGPGVWPKTTIFDDTRPDGLAGNSAYVIKPHAAARLIELCDTVGAWPNDAIMCRQFIDLQEHYPFITEVHAERSTIQN